MAPTSDTDGVPSSGTEFFVLVAMLGGFWWLLHYVLYSIIDQSF